METQYRRVAGIDVHRMKQVATILIELEDGGTEKHTREFGGYKRDLRWLVAWLQRYEVELVVMESTGIYWKSLYAALEKVGLEPLVVNAHHVKQVPGRKTDIADAQWLAILARSGLLKGGFVPPANFRQLRLLSRQLQKFTGILSGEKNRLHKVLTDGGVRLSVVVSDIHGKSARQMVKGLVGGESPEQVLTHASKRLKATDEQLLDALDGELRDTHRFVLSQILEHIEYLEERIGCFQQQLLKALQPQQGVLHALQTIPGLDEIGAAMLLVEIGDDMQSFGSSKKLAAWAGVCPGYNESAGKRKAGKKRKGNPYVRRILCEAANAASRTRSALADKFQALLIRRGRKRAIFALAHKLLKIVFVLISRGDYYRDATVDYEAMSVARNAPRWIRMLRNHGYIQA